jgi:1-acyl-sn-glycerol-3-phosphate acyltransferase
LTRRFIIAVLRFALRVFFRRVEVAGAERVPAAGPCVFVLNHPNGLVDPCFLLCFAPRRVSFLAKSPLFKTPVIGRLCRVMEAIPVYRRQDEGADTARNRETFAQAHALLTRGGTIGVCPEGVSHNEPSLRPLKSGAARIALGAASMRDEGGGVRDESETAQRTSSGSTHPSTLNPQPSLKIVPAGLYYTAKTTFRSGALLYFGDPVEVEPAEPDADGEPPREAVQRLSERIAAALREVTLNADHHEALRTVARAERIFSAEDEEEGKGRSLERELRRRRLFVEGYATLRERAPERLAALEARVRGYEEQLRQAGLEDPGDLTAVSRRRGLGHLVARALAFALTLPFALAGLAIHYPAYRLAGYLSTKFAANAEDVLSTVKIIAALLLFPLTWLAVAASACWLAGWRVALAALVVAPALGYVALRFTEELDRSAASARALLFFVARRGFFRHLLAERKAIRKEILALGEEAERAGTPGVRAVTSDE